MNTKLKHAFFSLALFCFALLWMGAVSASPFFMSPSMHTENMHCEFTTPWEKSCPMNLVEHVDEWTHTAVLFFLPVLLLVLVLSVVFALRPNVLQFVRYHLGPPGISWLQSIPERWALSQGILNPKLYYLLHV